MNNLGGLQQIQIQPSLNNVLYFVGNSEASLLSRPISMLSFALQYDAWPEPKEFKFVNLNIHLLNGCLIFWVFLRLGRLILSDERKIQSLALSTAAIWMIHPLNLSTTLYVIQRMTQLSTLFTLLGILAYLIGRSHLPHHNLLKGYLWMSGGVVLGGLLATLSKENGVLLPLLILIMEGTILRPIARPGPWRSWSALFLLAPTITLLIYFGMQWETYFVVNYQTREFTLAERVLTEFRVLSDYLRMIFLPSLAEMGLFHDDYPISHGPFNPPSTFIAMIFISSLLLSGLFWRKRAPVLAFGLLWFFAGHLLESTVLSLELYFEHRNYLPSSGLWFAVIYGGFKLWEHPKMQKIGRVLLAGAITICALFSFQTYSESRLWGDPILQTETWANKHPNSRRAQSQLAFFLANVGQFDKVEAIYRQLSETFPKDMGVSLYWLRLSCNYPKIGQPDQTRLLQQMRSGLINRPALEEIINAMDRDECPNISIESMLTLLKALTNNPSNISKASQSQIDYSLSILEEKAGHRSQALAHLESALIKNPSVALVLMKVAWLSQAKQFADALKSLDEARAYNRGNPLTWRLNNQRIEEWDAKLRLLIKKGQGEPLTPVDFISVS
ncbi:MAG: hypothetical protein HQL94_07890 [Magnetococcales bacterium]|nr:hypothetical protein [Magnetococcales bacterium]